MFLLSHFCLVQSELMAVRLLISIFCLSWRLGHSVEIGVFTWFPVSLQEMPDSCSTDYILQEKCLREKRDHATAKDERNKR